VTDPTTPAIDSDVAEFFTALRRLKWEAGDPDYKELMRRTGYGRTALSKAFNGPALPTWPTVERLVGTLGGDVAQWRARWAAVRAAEDAAHNAEPDGAAPPPPAELVQPGEPVLVAGPVRRLWRWWLA
jgi:hypothetical protein